MVGTLISPSRSRNRSAPIDLRPPIARSMGFRRMMLLTSSAKSAVMWGAWKPISPWVRPALSERLSQRILPVVRQRPPVQRHRVQQHQRPQQVLVRQRKLRDCRTTHGVANEDEILQTQCRYRFVQVCGEGLHGVSVL